MPNDGRNNPDVSSAGLALQAAWLGGGATSHRPTATSRRHFTVVSVMVEVRRTLYAAGRPLQLKELRAVTGQDGMAIGSCLVKLRASGLVAKLPPVAPRPYGASYLWVGPAEPEARQWAA